jgi:hypothetical protein
MNETSNEPFNLFVKGNEMPCLRLELSTQTASGPVVVFYPYILLHKATLSDERYLQLAFGDAEIQINGENLTQLFIALQSHKVEVIRVGKTSETVPLEVDKIVSVPKRPATIDTM